MRAPLLPVVVFALSAACVGPSGPPGEKGSSCRIQEVISGVKRITCGDGTSVEVKDGAAAQPCVIERTATGAKITCPDGSNAVVEDGTDGADGDDGLSGADGDSCSVSEVAGVKKITCSDGTEIELGSTGGGSALVRVTDEPAGEACPGGGNRIETGVDDDADGTLDDTEVDGTAFICRPEGPAPCEVFEGNVSLQNTLDLKAFAALGCPVVHGDFEVRGPFADLSSLAFVEEVTAGIVISYTEATTLNFPNLRQVGDDVQFLNNARLVSVSLPALERTLGLRVLDSPSFTTFSAPRVTSLSGLEFGNLAAFAGPVDVPALVEVTDNFSIRGLPLLTSLAGFPALRRVHTLTVQQVPLLASFRLPALRRVWSGVIVEDAPNLDQCALDALLQPVSIKGPSFALLDLDAGPRGCVGTKDADGDGVLNVVDNCVTAVNPAQADSDANGTGNACQARVPGAGHLKFNELLADPPLGTTGDANGDGTRDAQDDEFVELVNVSDQPLLMNGVTLHRLDTGFTPAPFTANVRFTFPAFTLLPGRAVVVFGGGTPTGFFGEANVFKAGTSKLSLTDTTYLQLVAAGTEVTKVAYNAAPAGADNVALTANTLKKSINRSPDVTGTTFLAHDAITGSVGVYSPGTKSSGAPF